MDGKEKYATNTVQPRIQPTGLQPLGMLGWRILMMGGGDRLHRTVYVYHYVLGGLF